MVSLVVSPGLVSSQQRKKSTIKNNPLLPSDPVLSKISSWSSPVCSGKSSSPPQCRPPRLNTKVLVAASLKYGDITDLAHRE